MLSYIKFYFNHQVLVNLVRRLKVSIPVLWLVCFVFGNLYAQETSFDGGDKAKELDSQKEYSEEGESEEEEKGSWDYLFEYRDWEKYVRFFRKEHSFSFLLGYSYKTWVYDRVDERMHSEVNGIKLSLRYNYDISLYRGIGYFLGSSFFYKHRLSSSENFNVAYEYNLPGFAIGLVLNVNPLFRVYTGVELMVIRVLDLERVDFGKQRTDMSMPVLNFMTIFDVFYSLKGGIRVEIGYDVNLRLRYLNNHETSDSIEAKTEEILKRNITKDMKINLGYVYNMM